MSRPLTKKEAELAARCVRHCAQLQSEGRFWGAREEQLKELADALEARPAGFWDIFKEHWGAWANIVTAHPFHGPCRDCRWWVAAENRCSSSRANEHGIKVTEPSDTCFYWQGQKEDRE